MLCLILKRIVLVCVLNQSEGRNGLLDSLRMRERGGGGFGGRAVLLVVVVASSPSVLARANRYYMSYCAQWLWLELEPG